jgi:hypothetical protein
LARHVETHPEAKTSSEHLRLVMKCQELERQLDRLEKSTADSTQSKDQS